MTKNTTERSELIFTGPRGYACDLAQTADGWAMAYVSMDHVDDRFVSRIGGKLPLWVECADIHMGASGNVTLPVDFRLSLPPDAPLRSLKMMRNGQWLEPAIVRDDNGVKTLRDEHPVPGSHFYVFRIESDFGPHGETVTACTSPIWLTV